LSAAAERADRAGLAVAIHAIGDRANREVIDLLERAVSTRPKDLSPPSAPHRIEHAQLLHPEDVPRLARLGQRGVVPSMQPIHATDDMTMVERSIGMRASRAYVFRSLMRADAPLVFGSDAPVATPDPWWGIHAAVTRRRRDGTPEGGWHPAQQLTVSQAIWAYTMGPALASGRVERLGSITPGKLADLQVVNRDPLTVDPMALADCEVEMTVVGGRIVHRSF
jgi:predicted amidohydrolase YtcJ